MENLNLSNAAAQENKPVFVKTYNDKMQPTGVLNLNAPAPKPTPQTPTVTNPIPLEEGFYICRDSKSPASEPYHLGLLSFVQFERPFEPKLYVLQNAQGLPYCWNGETYQLNELFEQDEGIAFAEDIFRQVYGEKYSYQGCESEIVTSEDALPVEIKAIIGE